MENEELSYGIKGCVERFQDNCNPSRKWEAESKDMNLVLFNTKSDEISQRFLESTRSMFGVWWRSWMASSKHFRVQFCRLPMTIRKSVGNSNSIENSTQESNLFSFAFDLNSSSLHFPLTLLVFKIHLNAIVNGMRRMCRARENSNKSSLTTHS